MPPFSSVPTPEAEQICTTFIKKKRMKCDAHERQCAERGSSEDRLHMEFDDLGPVVEPRRRLPLRTQPHRAFGPDRPGSPHHRTPRERSVLSRSLLATSAREARVPRTSVSTEDETSRYGAGRRSENLVLVVKVVRHLAQQAS